MKLWEHASYCWAWKCFFFLFFEFRILKGTFGEKWAANEHFLEKSAELENPAYDFLQSLTVYAFRCQLQTACSGNTEGSSKVDIMHRAVLPSLLGSVFTFGAFAKKSKFKGCFVQSNFESVYLDRLFYLFFCIQNFLGRSWPFLAVFHWV